MMNAYRLTFSHEATENLEAIGVYIQQDNPQRALSFVKEIYQKCHDLCLFPKRCPARPDLGETMRLMIHGRHCVFYSVDDAANTVRVEKILHASRDVPLHFTPEP